MTLYTSDRTTSTIKKSQNFHKRQYWSLFCLVHPAWYERRPREKKWPHEILVSRSGISGGHFVLEVFFSGSASKKGTTVLIQSVCTWSTSCSHIGVLKQWNIGHVGALNRSCGSSNQTLSFFSNKFAWLLDTWLHALYSRGGEDLWLGCTYWIIYRTVHKWRGKTFWQIQNSFLNCTAGRSWQAFYTMAQRHPHMRLKLMYNSLV